MRVEEILGSLEQTDLLPKEVCILDCFDKVFIWNGKEASDAEKASSEGFAKKFLETDPRGRSIDTPIISENQGFLLKKSALYSITFKRKNQTISKHTFQSGTTTASLIRIRSCWKWPFK